MSKRVSLPLKAYLREQGNLPLFVENMGALDYNAQFMQLDTVTTIERESDMGAVTTDDKKRGPGPLWPLPPTPTSPPLRIE
mmetsp:Transcript_9380/g.20336  ORF Transcript_9380/g.20336 Transcript_9380/m.20336 type:complete len:81 (+) Transcript_9380:266-508(+)